PAPRLGGALASPRGGAFRETTGAPSAVAAEGALAGLLPNGAVGALLVPSQAAGAAAAKRPTAPGGRGAGVPPGSALPSPRSPAADLPARIPGGVWVLRAALAG